MYFYNTHQAIKKSKTAYCCLNWKTVTLLHTTISISSRAGCRVKGRVTTTTKFFKIKNTAPQNTYGENKMLKKYEIHN